MKRIKEETSEKHIFALYIESLSSLLQKSAAQAELIIVDEQLFHRIITVLRLQMNDRCILFDRIMHATCVLAGFIGKKQLHFNILSQKTNTIYTPEITFLLPVLKRDDYENALYTLVELGVNTIQLVFTQKTASHWDAMRDTERARRIMIAAAEQSKNFAFPTFKQPISFEKTAEEEMIEEDIAKIPARPKKAPISLPSGEIASQTEEFVEPLYTPSTYRTQPEQTSLSTTGSTVKKPQPTPIMVSSASTALPKPISSGNQPSRTTISTTSGGQPTVGRGITPSNEYPSSHKEPEFHWPADISRSFGSSSYESEYGRPADRTTREREFMEEERAKEENRTLQTYPKPMVKKEFELTPREQEKLSAEEKRALHAQQHYPSSAPSDEYPTEQLHWFWRLLARIIAFIKQLFGWT